MKDLYHISFNSNLPSVLLPREPDMLSEDSNEHNLGKRVSFAPTVRQCAIALYFNLPKDFTFNKEVSFYVYKLNTTKTLKEIPRVELEKHIFDVKNTDEVCITEPCPIKKIGKIGVKYDKNKPIYTEFYSKQLLAGYEPTIKVTEFYTNDVINIDGIVQVERKKH